MRKWISLLLAVLLVLGMPMTAMAIEVDAQFGDVTIGDTHVSHTDSSNASRNDAHGGEVVVQNSGSTTNTVSVNMDGQAEGDVTVPESVTVKGENGSPVNVNGGVYASDGVNVTVEGNVSGADNVNDADETTTVGGTGVYAAGSTVTVTGSVSGGDATGDNAHGGRGVYAYGSTVTVNGSVTGGTATGGDSDDDYAQGGIGVYAYGNSTVTVNGSVTGGYASGGIADSGSAVEARSGSQVTVDGNAAGGDAVGNVAFGGEGVAMDSSTTVEVGGAVAAGSGYGKEPSIGNVGIDVTVDSESAPGSVTVKGEVSGSGDAPDIQIGTSPNGYDTHGNLIFEDGDVADVPSIGVGYADSIYIYGFTEEETQQILDTKITGYVAPTVSAESAKEESQTRRYGVSTSGYSKGALWRKGYITRTLFKIENGKGMKPVWEEVLEGKTLTITAENEPVVFTTWLNGMKELQELGIETIVIKTADCETELVLADLIAMKGTEYVLTQEGENATLTVDGKSV